MKNLLLVLLLITISCNSHSSCCTKEKKIDQLITTDSCNSQLVQLIVTSGNFENPFKEQLSAEIKQNDKNRYTIELYVFDSGENARNTVGWVELNLADNTLKDITNDPDSGMLLHYNKNLYDNYLSECLKISRKKDVASINSIHTCKLPFDFNKYYDASLGLSGSPQEYPQYPYTNTCSLSKILRDKYCPSEYMYLPPMLQYEIVILCNTNSDIESYDLIVINKGQIVSSLQVGKMDGQSVVDFEISEDYIITLYRMKISEKKRVHWKSYKITPNGEIKIII